MIDFLTNEVREEFHKLPIDKQREWNEISERYLLKGQVLQILFVEDGPEGLEVSIRVNKKFDVTV